MHLDPFLKAIIVRKIDIEEHDPSAAFIIHVIVFSEGVSDKHKRQYARGRFSCSFELYEYGSQAMGGPERSFRPPALRLGGQMEMFRAYMSGVRVEMNHPRAAQHQHRPSRLMGAGHACDAHRQPSGLILRAPNIGSIAANLLTCLCGVSEDAPRVPGRGKASC